MAKDPAFLFYPNDYLGGTMGMTFEEKGAYIELLMLQFNRGHMTSHMIGHTVGHLWDKIKDKFVQDEKGLYYNVRLQDEQEKRVKYSESRRNNKKGENQYTKKGEHMTGHMTSHMENENENSKYSINVLSCKEIAIKDLQWMERNNPTEKEFKEFIDLLTDRGDTVKTPKDFKSHFSNWKKGKKEEKSEPIKHLSL
jgi:uncharacterized protein YdaU (DUF1376 family)